MRYYSPSVKTRVLAGPDTIGTRLARLALQKGFSVQDIGLYTGATRATVYNWFAGRGVTKAYRERVAQLTHILKTSKSPEAARRKACSISPLPD